MPTDERDDPIATRIDELYENTVLTRKQSEVLALREAGYTTAAIARRMDIQSSMVRLHESNIDDRLKRARQTLALSDDFVQLRTGRGERKYVRVPFTSDGSIWTV